MMPLNIAIALTVSTVTCAVLAIIAWLEKLDGDRAMRSQMVRIQQLAAEIRRLRGQSFDRHADQASDLTRVSRIHWTDREFRR